MLTSDVLMMTTDYADLLSIKTDFHTGSCSGLNLGEINILNQGMNEQHKDGALLLRLLVLVSSQGAGLSASECNTCTSESLS